jgi:hypothetical protein
LEDAANLSGIEFQALVYFLSIFLFTILIPLHLHSDFKA